ncbi:caspase family protein [Lacinutrix iliipiscaria]|uniref:Caspase family protein n=1 Tax=Lacinutrix iliipiscaria TaxID=1230532 RepID=A0ABW5WSX4_9FLAO
MSTLSNAYALIIGVGDDLPVSVKDAESIYSILADEELAGYPKENIILITNKKANRKGILEAFDTIISKTDENSSVMLFYSGHGGLYEPWNQFYLVPNGFDDVNYETTWVTAEELKEKIASITSRRLIFFLDCCHAAGMTQSVTNTRSAKTGAKDNLEQADGLAQRIDDGRGMSIVSSCRENQLSYILDGDVNSLYTKCLIEVLKGEHRAYFDEPYVRISEVVRYIFKKVPERYPTQNPYANLQIYDDFILSNVPKNLQDKVIPIEGSNTEEQRIDSNKTSKKVVTVYKETENANNVILFVHGFSGQSSESFGEIPELLANESDLEGWNMFPLGYSENMTPELGKNTWASENDIKINSAYLKTSIKHKYEKYDRIAIIAHSLGGLVVQRAILDLDKNLKDKISHVFLFGTPNNGLDSSTKNEGWNNLLKDLHAKSPFIKSLRKDWNSAFNHAYPFTLKVIAGTNDEYVTVKSNLTPFKDEDSVTVEGSHYSIIQKSDRENDTYDLIKSTLTNTTFLNQFTSKEDINLVLGEYDAVIKKLLPNTKALDKKGLTKLIFALEGMDRRKEALDILNTHDLAKDNSDLLGILGGRYKRKYLAEYEAEHGLNAIKYYKQALEIAEGKNDINQIYYHAINLAFLSLIINEDYTQMKVYAEQALEATKKIPLNNMWKLATLGEASLYLGDLEASKSYYKQASKMAGIREKISIHTNAYMAYTSMMQTDDPQDGYIKFLKSKFLS